MVQTLWFSLGTPSSLPSHVKNKSTELMRLPGGFYFSISTGKVLSHPLLTDTFPVGKSAVRWTCTPLCVTFSLPVLRSLFKLRDLHDNISWRTLNSWTWLVTSLYLNNCISLWIFLSFLLFLLEYSFSLVGLLRLLFSPSSSFFSFYSFLMMLHVYSVYVCATFLYVISSVWSILRVLPFITHLSLLNILFR